MSWVGPECINTGLTISALYCYIVGSTSLQLQQQQRQQKQQQSAMFD